MASTRHLGTNPDRCYLRLRYQRALNQVTSLSFVTSSMLQFGSGGMAERHGSH